LASNTKKREGKTTSSLKLLFNVFIIVIVIAFGIAVPSPRVFHSWRRIDNRLGGLKTHRSVHLALALLKSRKPLTHLTPA
jgi:thiosulfate reductase cytochrome b subunit